MIWVLVQTASSSTSGLVSSATATFGSSVTPGNLVVIRTTKGFSGSVGTDGVADNKSNGYTPGPQGIGGTTQKVACQVWGCIPSTGGAGYTVTFTPAASSLVQFTIDEYSASGASITDGSGFGSGTGTGLSTSSFTTTGIDLIVAVGATKATGQTWTAGSGFTLGTNAPGSSSTIAFACEDALNASPGTYTPTMTDSSGTFWACAAMAFSVGVGGTGSYSISGATSTLEHARVEVGASGSYGITGQSSPLAIGLPGVVGSYATTGVPASFLHDREIVTVGSYAITGKTATLTPSIVLVGTAGVYAIAGQAASLLDDQVAVGTLGSYGVTGTPATLQYPFTLPAATGSYLATGATATLEWGHDLPTSAGSYSIAGASAALTASGTGILAGATGVYQISRITADLVDDHILAGATGAYAITGTPATFAQPFTLPTSPGSYAITGLAATTGRQVTQSGTPGVYLITGQVATLTIATADGSPGPVAYHVYANSGVGDPIDYDDPVFTTSGLTYTTAPLSFPGTWSFGVRAFYVDSMLEEHNLDCAVTIILDAAGHDITNRPAPPSGLRAIPLAQGAIRVEWFYPPTTGPKAPTAFHVYIQVGVLSYATPVATVLFSMGIANSFVANVPGFMDQTTYTVGVRAFNSTAEETNTNTVTVTAIASGPSPVVGLVGVATAQGA